MNDKEREYKIVLAWAIRLGLASEYENLDKPLTKREFLKILYKLFNRYIGGKSERC